MHPIYTVGHGNRTLTELLALLQEAGVDTLVDVRARPSSRRHPHFAAQSLRAALEQDGSSYRWAGGGLGGLRHPRPRSPHTDLPDALRGYADYMQTKVFRQAATQLVRWGTQTRLAILCAERSPQHCHRSLIADYLTLQRVTVVHLVESGVSYKHELSPLLRCEGEGLIYDRHCQRTLDL